MDRVRRTIKFDGLIQLQCADGFLCGAGIEGSRLYLRSPAVNETGDEVFPFFHFSPNVFKVVPTLSSMADAAKLMDRSSSGQAGEEDGPGSSQSATLASHLETLAHQEITYGMVFSIVHAASNLYVSVVHSQRSQNDPDCVSVVLTPAASANSPSCEFTFVSRYKIHSDGDKVTRDDEILIRLAAKPLFLHVSSPRELDISGLLAPEDVAVLDRTFRLGSRLTYHKVPKEGLKQQSQQQQIMMNPGSMWPANNTSFALSLGESVSMMGRSANPIVLQALTREHLDEVNGCEEGGVSFTLHRYDAEVDKAIAQRNQLHLNRTHMTCGVPVAFFHRERESFLTTSVTAPRKYVSHAGALVDTMDEPPRLKQRKPRSATEGFIALTGAEGQVHEMSLQGDAANEGRSGSLQLAEDGSIQGPSRSASAAKDVEGPGYRPGPAGSACSGTTAMSQRTEKAANARQQRRITGVIDAGNGELLPYPTFAVTPIAGEDEDTATESTLADNSCNINALWMIEAEDPSHGGPVKIGNTYRIKHIYTGLYLAVCGSAVDDIFQEEDELSDGHLATEGGRSVTSSMNGEDGNEADSPLTGNQNVAAALAGTKSPGLNNNSMVNTSFVPGALAAAFRETSLCLVMEPRSTKDLERTLFTFEYMFANDASYLFEQDSIVIKNLLTGMFVATDSSVSGPNIRLQLQWQHRASDTIVATNVPVDFQRSALFIRQQCIWLSRYREQMQAAAVDLQRDRITLQRAAANGNKKAELMLQRDEEDAAQIRTEVEEQKEGGGAGDPDAELLNEHKKRSLADYNKKKKKKDKRKKKKHVDNLSFHDGADADNLSMRLDDDDDDEVEHMHPRYRSLQHTIRLCQRSLTTLICFCTNSDDMNPLTREGLPIKENQRMLFDTQLYKLVFEVIMAPFCLLHKNYTQTAMIQNPRDFEELGSYEGTALYQTIVQRQSTDRLWDESAAIPGAGNKSPPLRLPEIPFSGGVIPLEDITHPIHGEIHLCCRLAFRLLRQMILEDSALGAGWEHYLRHCLAMDGRRLHVIEVLQELFTDNPRIALSDIQLVSHHFISATKAIPRSAYLKFLGAACTIGEKGVPARQQHLCKKLLVENPQLLSKFVMDARGEGLSVIPNAPNSKPIPFQIFFTSYHDSKMISFVHGQMRLMTRLCFDGCPNECVEKVSSLLPVEGMRMALRAMWTSSTTNNERPGHSGPLDLLRAQLIRLSFLTYVWPKMSHPHVQLRVKTILFGASRLRPDPKCPFLSGVADEEIAALLKQTTLAILRANPFLIQGDAARNELIRTCVTVWLRFVECKQYTKSEIEQLIPIFLNLLDGSKDLIGLHKPPKEVERLQAQKFELSAESIPMMVIRETMCKCLLGALRNEMYRSADEIVLFLYRAYTKGLKKTDPKPWQCRGDVSGNVTLVNLLVDNLAREGQELQNELRHGVGDVVATVSKGGYMPLGRRQRSHGDSIGEEEEEEDYDERSRLRGPEAVEVDISASQLVPQNNNLVSEASLSTSGSNPQYSHRHLRSPDDYYTVTKEDVEQYIDMMVDRIHAAFSPALLVPLLLSVTRYKRKTLTVHSMRLLVQMSVVKRTITQQVLMVNTIPCRAVRRGFDSIHDIAVALKTVFYEQGTYNESKWLPAIARTVACLEQRFDEPDSETPRGENGDGASFFSEREFLQMYSSLNHSSGSVSSFASGTGSTFSPTSPDDASMSPARRRAIALWSKLAVVTRLIVFKNTVSRRRRALGIYDGNDNAIDLTVRADFMYHFKIHETLIRMLPSVPPESEAYFHIIRFFYLFSLSESTAQGLRPFIDTFVAAVDASPRTHVMCLHIVVNILHIMSDVNDYLTPVLLYAFVRQIDAQVRTKLPDADFVERLSNRIFLKTSVSVVIRRRMMLLLRQQKTLRQLSNPPPHPSPAEVTFISALVNLMCNVCGCHVSVLILARGLLPSESICKMVEKRLRRNRKRLLSSDKSFRHVTDSETVSFKLLNPYVRALVALYFTSMDDNDEDKRRRTQEWMREDLVWNIFSYYVVVMNEATRLMKIQDERQGGGRTADTNKGIAGVQLYRIFFLKTIPISLAAFFSNCYDSTLYFEHRNAGFAEVKEGEYVPGNGGGCRMMGFILPDLLKAMRRFAETLLSLDTAFDLGASDVVNLRRAIGVLRTVAMGSELPEEGRLGESLSQEMRVWLANRQEKLQKQQESMGNAACAAAEMDDDDDEDSNCLEGKEAEEGMFEVLVKEELVSTTLQRKASTRHWRQDPRSVVDARMRQGALGTLRQIGTQIGTIGSIVRGGDRRPSNGGSEANTLLEVQRHLSSLLEGDELIPCVNQDPSIVALIANHLLVHALEDRVAKQCVRRVLQAMMDRLFTARTFVGLLNLFYNALDCALRHPAMVDDILQQNRRSVMASSGGVSAVAMSGLTLVGSISMDAVQRIKNAAWAEESAAVPTVKQQSYGPNLQCIFSDLGMMEVVMTLSGVEDDVVALNALRVATALLDNGNKRVQKDLLRYFETREEAFFHNIQHILRKNLEWVQYVNSDHQYYLLRRGLKANAAGLESTSATTINMQLVQAIRPRGNGLMYKQDPGENRKMGWSKAQGLRRLSLIRNVYRLLQLFCEGHNAGMQNYIRAQHDNLHSANMIHESMLLMAELTQFITPSNLDVVVQGFDLLTEVCQGPCHTNQEAVVDYGVCNMMTRVLRRTRIMEQYRNEEAAAAAKGAGGHGAVMTDTTYHFDDYVSEEDMGEIRKAISTTALSLIEGCRNPEFLEKLLLQFPLQVVKDEIESVDPRKHFYIANNDSEEDDASSEALYQWLILLMSLHPHVNEVDAAQISDVLERCQELTRYIGRVEVSRESDVEVVYFRIPPLCTSLTDDRKDVLLWQVDRTSRATKLSDFLQKSDELIFSMEQLFDFRQSLRRWTRFQVNYDPDAPFMTSMINSGKTFFNDYVSGVFFSHQISYYEQISMLIAVIVNCILTLVEGDTGNNWTLLQRYQGSVVMALCLAQTVVCTVILAIDLIVGYPIHLYSQYKEKQRYTEGEAKLNVTMTEVYAGLTLGERVTTLLSWFVLQLRVFFLIMAALSVFVSPYFAAFNLMLLIYKISTLRTFITAITMNGKQLLLTSFLGLIILYLFSIVGFLVFSSEFNPDAEDDTPITAADNNCQTLLRCFVYIFSQGLRAGGGVADVMKPWGWGEEDIVPRVNYDILFYVLVNVVYLNIMFGIIIDTFGQMRDEKREKEADMHGMCFICGLESDTLEKISPSGFTTHVKHEHNMWMYLYFMHHLRRKDPSDYTGQESYVNAKILANRLNFFPNQCCIALLEMNKREQENVSSDDEDDDEDDEEEKGGGEERGGGRASAAAAAAGNSKALAAATRELTTLKESFNNALKDLSGDTLRLKGVLQQLELATKGGGSLYNSEMTGGGGPPPSQGRQSAATRRFAGGPPGVSAGSERGSQRTQAFSQPQQGGGPMDGSVHGSTRTSNTPGGPPRGPYQRPE